MNKAELAQVLAEKLNVSKRGTEEMINTMVDVITETLKKSEEVVLTGFGAFSAKTRAARTGVNPQNPTEKGCPANPRAIPHRTTAFGDSGANRCRSDGSGTAVVAPGHGHENRTLTPIV